MNCFPQSLYWLKAFSWCHFISPLASISPIDTCRSNFHKCMLDIYLSWIYFWKKIKVEHLLNKEKLISWLNLYWTLTVTWNPILWPFNLHAFQKVVLKQKLTQISIFALLCGASKGFTKNLKAFIKLFKAPQRIMKIKF